jgi:HAD superfamily hydrolase (TIGR01450 family)
MWPPPPGGTWVIDLDGVVWLSGRPIPGVDGAIAALRGAGVRTLFATNNSAPTRGELRRRLEHCGITAADADLLRSADVAAGLLAPGSSAFVLGEDGLVEAVTARGVTVVPEGPADAVVVGWTRNFTFDAVARAAAAVRSGARLIGTNEDPTFPTPDGLVPGAGAVLAAVATASETEPEVAGKPHRATADAIAARVAPGELRAMVGDRPATDGALAAQLGIPFALVLSGVTPPRDVPADTGAVATAKDLAALVTEALGDGAA